MGIDPGRLPYKALLKDAHRAEREAEARAELHAQLHSDDGEGTTPARGVRRALRRLRRVIGRRG
jgi:hypothetical protein